MAVTKIIEVVGSSPESSDGAVKAALDDARQSLRNIKAVDVVSTGPARRQPRRVARARAHRLPGRARQRVTDRSARALACGRPGRILIRTASCNETENKGTGARRIARPFPTIFPPPVRPQQTQTGPQGGAKGLLKEHYRGLLEDARARTLWLVEPVSRADLDRVHTPLLSPLVWDLGHIAAFEDLWLCQQAGGLALLRDRPGRRLRRHAHPARRSR